jgi:hypothetical protein
MALGTEARLGTLVRPGGMGVVHQRPLLMAGEWCVATWPANGPGQPCGLGKRKETSGPPGCAGKKKWVRERESAHEVF